MLDRYDWFWQFSALEKVGFLVLLAAAFIMLAGPLVLVADGFRWLQTGESGVTPTSSLLPTRALPYSTLRWLSTPTSWLGLHRLVTAILNLPLGIVLVAVGILLMFPGMELFKAGETSDAKEPSP